MYTDIQVIYWGHRGFFIPELTENHYQNSIIHIRILIMVDDDFHQIVDVWLLFIDSWGTLVLLLRIMDGVDFNFMGMGHGNSSRS